jgi:hypothetical protein
VKSAPRRLQIFALAQLADKNPETITLHFVQPAGPGGRTVDQHRLTPLSITVGQVSIAVAAAGHQGREVR